MSKKGRTAPPAVQPNISRVRDTTQPTFSRQIQSEEPVFYSEEPSTKPKFSRNVSTKAPVVSLDTESETPVFSRKIASDAPLIFAAGVTPELHASPEAPMDTDLREDASAGISATIMPENPAGLSEKFNSGGKAAAIPDQLDGLSKDQLALELFRQRTLPSDDPDTPIGYPAEIFRFISPYVADHIIAEDAFKVRDKFFDPPRYARKADVRNVDSVPEKPVPFTDRSSTPPPDFLDMDLDTLQPSETNFNPPKQFRYTREQIQLIHDRVVAKDTINWNNYEERLQALITVNRAALQMLMKMASDLTQYQQGSQEIRDVLEGALEELSKEIQGGNSGGDATSNS